MRRTSIENRMIAIEKQIMKVQQLVGGASNEMMQIEKVARKLFGYGVTIDQHADMIVSFNRTRITETVDIASKLVELQRRIAKDASIGAIQKRYAHIAGGNIQKAANLVFEISQGAAYEEVINYIYSLRSQEAIVGAPHEQSDKTLSASYRVAKKRPDTLREVLIAANEAIREAETYNANPVSVKTGKKSMKLILKPQYHSLIRDWLYQLS